MKTKVLTCTGIVAGGAMLGGTAFAQGSGTVPPVGTYTFYGCVGAVAGQQRMIDHVYITAQGFSNAGNCPGGQFAVAWNAQGPAGLTGAAGPAGPQGPAGTFTPVTATADTSVSNRDDSGNNGNWATDAFTRTVTVTRHSASPAGNCGAAAAKCWFYTAALADTGTFTTDTGAKSPNAGTVINGVVDGTFTGGSDIEFYASSDTPSAASVPGTVSGDMPSTTNWAAQFFPAGTVFSTPNLTDWSWTYVAPKTCEKWTDAVGNGDGHLSGDGDITGTNACSG